MNEPHNSNGNCYLRPDPSLFQIKKIPKVENVNKNLHPIWKKKTQKKSKSGKFFLLFGSFWLCRPYRKRFIPCVSVYSRHSQLM